MTENGNQTPPVRTLTVKNFSVIKEAKLEFGKITVLIGPQSSGKSLLSKLAYFLSREAIKIAVDYVVNRQEFKEFEAALLREFERWFPRGGWGELDWSITFASSSYTITITAPSGFNGESAPKAAFAEQFVHAYSSRLRETLEEQNKRGFLIGQALQSLAATRFFKIAGRGVWDASTYIPLERSYFVDTKKGLRAVASGDDPISEQFANVYANSLNSSNAKPRATKLLGGQISLWQDEWMFSFHDGRFLPLSHLSSGSKEILPILIALDYYEAQRTQSGNLPEAELYGEKLYFFDDFTVEEPEASVFPQTQYQLVREFVALTRERNFQPYFTITTHSPYILSAFNNLIEAGQAARNNPTLHDAVARIVPEQYWIKEGDFKAYAIEDGQLKSILNESGFIEGNYLDQVSEVIGDEFDKLLRLEYEHTKAS